MRDISVSFALGWPIWGYILLTATVLLSVFLFYTRIVGYVNRRDLVILVSLRGLGMIALLLCLFRPVLSFQKPLTERSRLLFLVDTSQSMSIKDYLRLPNRLDSVKSLLCHLGTLGTSWASTIDELSQDFDLAFYAFDADLRKVASASDLNALKPEGTATRIGNAIVSVVNESKNRPIEGVVLFSDGIDNSGTNPVDLVADLKVPVFAVGVGSKLREQKNFRDIELVKVETNRTATVGNVATVTAFVDAYGYPDRLVQVGLYLDGKEITQERLVLDNQQGAQQVTLNFTPQKLGHFEYEVRVPVDPEERIAQNNVRTFPLNVTKPHIRVLYIEGTLRWEYKFLKRTLDMDPNIDLVCLVKIGESMFYQQGKVAGIKLKGIPQTKDQFEKFNVFILGDVDRTHFTTDQMTYIRDLVRSGAGLLMQGGYHSFGPGGYEGTPIEEALPVFCGGRDIGQEKDPFLMKLTPEGLIHPIFSGCQEFFTGKSKNAVLPELQGCTILKGAKPGATVLAIHPTKQGPDGKNLIVLAVQQYGKGRSAALSVDTTWKWELPLRALGRESPYVKFWGQLIRWLANREKTEAEAQTGIIAYSDKSYYKPGEKAEFFVQAFQKNGLVANHAHVTAQIESPSGTEKIPIPYIAGSRGEYKATYEPRVPGTFKITIKAEQNGESLGETTFQFHMGQPNLEFDNLDLNESLLRQLARQTNGYYYTLVTFDNLVDTLRSRMRERIVYEEKPLWNFPILFFAFVLLVTAEWILRRQQQLS